MSEFLGPTTTAIIVEVTRMSLLLAFLSAIFVPLELTFAARPKKVFRAEFLIDLGYYVINSFVVAFVLSFPVGIIVWATHKTIPAVWLASTAAWPLWARALGGLVAGEIGYYWGHRLSHEIPFLWDFHAIHHSAEEMDYLVSSRAHPIDLVFSRLCALAPIYALGLGAVNGTEGIKIPLVVTFVGLIWGTFIHANLKWRFGPLEWLISTPGFHHWHHTKSGPINRNYSTMLPWMDWLFGTLHLPANELPSDYGIKAKLPESLIGQLAYPLFPPSSVSAPAPATPSEKTPMPWHKPEH